MNPKQGPSSVQELTQMPLQVRAEMRAATHDLESQCLREMPKDAHLNMDKTYQDFEDAGRALSQSNESEPPPYSANNAPPYRAVRQFNVVYTKACPQRSWGTGINSNDNTSCCGKRDKWFETSTVVRHGEAYWTCTRCRQLVQTDKYAFSRVNNLVFYCCGPCWQRYKLSAWAGLIARIVMMEMVFTMVWIHSPEHIWFRSGGRQLAASVVLFVATVLSVFLSFANLIALRPIGLLRRNQVRRPLLDFILEANVACWFAGCFALLVHQGIEQYEHTRWTGELIAMCFTTGFGMIVFSISAFVALGILCKSRTSQTGTIGGDESAARPSNRPYSLMASLFYLA